MHTKAEHKQDSTPGTTCKEELKYDHERRKNVEQEWITKREKERKGGRQEVPSKKKIPTTCFGSTATK